MKKQILTLIIGILIGAIITTAVFLVLKGNTGSQGNRMNRGEMPSMDGSFQDRGKDSSIPGEETSENTQDNSNNIEE